jgi:hypothetical protein
MKVVYEFLGGKKWFFIQFYFMSSLEKPAFNINVVSLISFSGFT